MINLLAIPLIGILNRIRGGGFGADVLPSRPLFWVIPIILLIGCYVSGYVIGGLFALAFLLWAFPSWGRWYTIGRPVPVHREVNAFEKIVEFIPNLLRIKNPVAFDIVAFTIRNIITFIPFIVAAIYFSKLIFLPIIFGIAITIVMLYWISWIIYEKFPKLFSILTAEILVGMLWGAILLLIKPILALYI